MLPTSTNRSGLAWDYLPNHLRPPVWATALVDAVGSVHPEIATRPERPAQRSDHVLQSLSRPLSDLDYLVGTARTPAGRIHRTVLFGENGVPAVTYDFDAVHEKLGVLVSIESGFGGISNIAYRVLMRACMVADSRHLALLMPVAFQPVNSPSLINAYRETRDMLSILYATRRITIPLDGVLVIGY